MAKILIVDDEPSVLLALQDMLDGLGHRVETATSGEEALRQVVDWQPELVVTDLCMPIMDGMEAFRRIKTIAPRLPVIIMTGQGTMNTAIEATKLGAFDYQLKPVDPESMMAAVERALESVRLMQRSVELDPREAISSRDAIIGQSPGMQEVYKAIGRVASPDATVLIRGESGTGKELVARAIYQHSRRAQAPLVIVNCAAIPETLLESEMFGYERGAFTGAHARKIGKFEQANGGTIFLDEIGDVPASVQPKILRVLQQRQVERVGGSETIPVDVRVLAATNRDLELAIADGAFREDLYYRLQVVTISIPPLRKRHEDVPKLANYFLQRFAKELNVEQPLLTEEARQTLLTYHWPGNVRELEHCIYRAMIFTRGYPIQAEHLLRARQESDTPSIGLDQEQLRGWIKTYLDTHAGDKAHERLLDEVERLLILEALQRTSGNQSQAARLLGITRPTLHAKIRKHQITGQHRFDSDADG
jgi:nitrogen regulation protein NR(I)